MGVEEALEGRTLEALVAVGVGHLHQQRVLRPGLGRGDEAQVVADRPAHGLGVELGDDPIEGREVFAGGVQLGDRGDGAEGVEVALGPAVDEKEEQPATAEDRDREQEGATVALHGFSLTGLGAFRAASFARAFR